jgi:hypothetical protein
MLGHRFLVGRPEESVLEVGQGGFPDPEIKEVEELHASGVFRPPIGLDELSLNINLDQTHEKNGYKPPIEITIGLGEGRQDIVVA